MSRLNQKLLSWAGCDITTAPFSYDKSSLLKILISTLASDAFKDRFLGILVLFDEFGDTMEKGNLSPKMFLF